MTGGRGQDWGGPIIDKTSFSYQSDWAPPKRQFIAFDFPSGQTKKNKNNGTSVSSLCTTCIYLVQSFWVFLLVVLLSGFLGSSSVKTFESDSPMHQLVDTTETGRREDAPQQ